MALTDAQRKANIKYRKESIKRVPLDMKKDKYDTVKAAADASGQAVNAYIKQAVDMRMESEGFIQPEQ